MEMELARSRTRKSDEWQTRTPLLPQKPMCMLDMHDAAKASFTLTVGREGCYTNKGPALSIYTTSRDPPFLAGFHSTHNPLGGCNVETCTT